jgi:flagellar hook-associated protein 2
MALTLSGAGSGIDINGLVQQLVAAERMPADQRLKRIENETRAQISAIGSLRSALGGLESALKRLDGTGMALGRKASVAEGAGFGATASGSAALGSYQIEVERLASTQKWQSAAVALNGDGSRPQVGYGTLTITLGDADPVVVTIDSGAGTLADIRDAINDQAGDLGVSATLVRGDSGEVLVLSSNRVGADSAIAVSASGGDGGLAMFDTATGTMTEKTPAQDGIVRVDGITRTVAGNTVADLIDGVTLQLSQAKPGETFRLDVASDPASLRGVVDEFVKAYNAAITQLRTQTAPGTESSSAGALRGDSAARGIMQALRTAVGTHYAAASALGLKTATDGTLTVDGSAFDAAVQADPSAVSRLLADADGLGAAILGQLKTYIGTDGLFEDRTENLNERLERLGKDREALDRRMGSLEARLRAQYSAMDTFIAQLNATSQFLVQRLSQ